MHSSTPPWAHEDRRNALLSTVVRGRSRAVMVAALAVAIGGLILYSQTLAYYGDEGVDLLTAQLVLAGKRPYIDFFYQHMPFFTYLTAGWMRLFGSGWRSAHALSAIFTSGALVLAVSYVRSRIDADRSSARTVATLTVILLFAAQYLVLTYATTAQAYGACLFFAVASFCLAVVSLKRRPGLAAFGAGFCAGAAAGSSLLAAPIAPIAIAWLLWHSQSASRARVASWFVFGAVLPFAPLIWLGLQAAHPVVFDTVSYHLWYRSEGWPVQWDLTTLGSGADSAQAILLAVLAAVGLFSQNSADRFDARHRKERQLCASMAMGLAACATLTRPTFEQYFVMAIPFAAILASFGVLAVASFAAIPARQRQVVALLAALPFLVTPARVMHRLSGGSEHVWQSLEVIGQRIDRVTPKDGKIWTTHIMYAAAGRLPPAGLETSIRTSLPRDEAQTVHLLSGGQVDEWVRGGGFDTVCDCDGDQSVEDLGLRTLYRQHIRLFYLDGQRRACDIFWDKTGR